MQYRTFSDADYQTLEALDLAAQRHADPNFDALPQREREGRLHTNIAALKFYERSEHSFVADDGEIRGFLFAQSVWQGDRPIVLVRTLTVAPGTADEVVRGLLHAAVKSAYDCAVYEVHYPVNAQTQAAAEAEESHLTGQYGVVHLGTRAQTAPGQKLTKSVRPSGA